MRIFHDPRPERWTPGTYQLYDASGDLLYIGVGVHPWSRITTHRRHQPWGRRIAVAVIDWWPTLEVARLAERAAIRSARPLHNVIRYESER